MQDICPWSHQQPPFISADIIQKWYLIDVSAQKSWQLLHGAERSESYVNLASYDTVPVERQMNDSIWYTYPDNWLSHKVSPSQCSGGLFRRDTFSTLVWFIFTCPFPLSAYSSASKHMRKDLIDMWQVYLRLASVILRWGVCVYVQTIVSGILQLSYASQ